MKGEVTKERILLEGAKIVYLKGYHATGLQEILKASGVPKGSFYFYFKSKKDYGLQLIDFYTDSIISRGKRFLEREDLGPLESLQEHVRWIIHHSTELGFKGGCPIGNLSQELGDTDDAFREKLNEAYQRLIELHALFLEEAQKQGEIATDLDTGEIAELIFNCYQGALIQMKVSRSTKPVEMIQRTILKLIS
jgi:TetR/AcrR family transcriptional regulator, transcriptional repressor for nem operon